MSIHPSLRGVNLTGERSVLTRFERILKLAKDGKLDPENESAFGLPKVRTKFKVAKAKKKEEAGEGAEGAEGEPGEAAEGTAAVEDGAPATGQAAAS
ncbi:MAG: small basic protein [Planctomycetota bacterium]|nr:small basic protein [Planctomycetota bacterium]